ncbi:HTH-type transcriptional regulator CynR [Pseudidiomarina piscicola]|uniref:HTH-type transcriptional regulator CynR n=1 Tax=Pseudidiomarina piscicola TaxID=2614830 RepID=A0A6S6WP06_9GAMM|nr:LysR family transcriptional regulator [Pseudidiomarina piscicola]CAB0151233.1 HTH-type transcriptional regulator CynR [Pseudidiomarina piscicola]VZT40739.1 HTH-type transcriptional regulator CynR [Pseudomonas aeruginosa]
MKKLSLKALEAFHTVMRTGSTTAAAAHLELTQPAVSRLLASFEAFVGFPLFHREHGRLIPTEEAQALSNEADVTLGSVERLAQLAHNIKNTSIGSLKVVAPVSFVAGLLADVVADFMGQHPNVTINLDSRSPDSTRELVAHRAFDCGFIQLPERHPGLNALPLFESRMMCALNQDHPLAQQQQLSPSDLAQQQLILLGKGRVSRGQIEQAFREHNLALRPKIDTHNVATACAFAKRGLGVAIVNGALAQQYLDEQLVLRPFTPAIPIEYGFITSKHAPMSLLTQSFMSHCQSALRREFE